MLERNTELGLFTAYSEIIKKMCAEGDFVSAFYQYNSFKLLCKDSQERLDELKGIIKSEFHKLTKDEKEKCLAGVFFTYYYEKGNLNDEAKKAYVSFVKGIEEFIDDFDFPYGSNAFLSPMVLALASKDIELVKYLQGKGVEVAINFYGEKDKLPLKLEDGETLEDFMKRVKQEKSLNNKIINAAKAEQENNILIEKAILRNDYRLSLDDIANNRALHKIVKNRNYGAISDLGLFSKLDVNAKDENGDTALHVAVKDSCVESVRALLKCEKVNIFAQDADGDTALHTALKGGDDFTSKGMPVFEYALSLRSKENAKM